MKRLSNLLFVFAVALPLGLVGPAWGQKEVRIGLTVSETGHFSTEVGPFRNLVEAWARDINHKGGVKIGDEAYAIKLFIYDDKSDEATARRMYERMAVVNQVHLMFGPYSSPLTFAASTAAENHGLPFLAICANSPRIYDRGFQWIACVIDEAPRYTYRYWDMLRRKGEAASVSFVVEDTLHPQGVFNGARALAEESGISVKSHHTVPPDMKDFSSVLVKLRRDNPDIVFVSSNVPFAIRFISQAREMQLKPKEFHVIHHGGIFRKALGEAAEYVTGQSYWTEGMKQGQYERFIQLLRDSRVSLEDYPWSPAYMMAFEVIEAVLAEAGTLAAPELMSTLKGLSVETIGGVIQFKSNGVGSINTYPSQIQNSRYYIIWPEEVATGRHVYPAP